MTNPATMLSQCRPARRRARRSLSQAAPRSTPRMMEELETRMLLSASGYATPSFLLTSTNSVIQSAAVSGPSGFSPATIRQAYGINQVLFGSSIGDGAGQTIAIVDAFNDPNIAGDLHAFDQQYGLSDPTLTRINQNGGSSLPGAAPGRGNSWALEISLDVQWAHAIAPAASILLVEAYSASDNDLAAAVNTARNYAGVSVVSMSWGGGEGTSALNDNLFTTPAGHTPITFIASAGDQGAYSSPSQKAVEFPASSPNVLAIGGTRLSVSGNGNYGSETGWGSGTSSYTNGGSGGGISGDESQPAFQKGIVTQSSNFRTVPDVAFDADPNSGVAVYDSYDSAGNPWLQVGGTSLGAPAWAAMIAIADEGRVLAGLSTLDGASQTLPALYALPSADFHDITSGNNGYAAGPGYDLVTGRGSPVANKLIPDLAGNHSTPTNPNPGPAATPVIGSFTLSAGQITSGANVILTAANVTETGGLIASVAFYEETNNIAGLQTLTDSLIGAGTRSSNNWSLSASTSGVAPGTYTLYAVATDANGATTSATVTLTVVSGTNAPVNDNFANATRLSGTSLSMNGSNAGATKQTGEPLHAGNSGGHSVWYSWTATQSGIVSLNTAGSNFDTLLAVYTGSAVNALTKVAANDDSPFSRTLTSALSFNAVAGVTYYFAVDGYDGATGKIVLNLAEAVTATRTGSALTEAKASANHLEAPALLRFTGRNLADVTEPHGGSATPAVTITANAGERDGSRDSLDGLSGNCLAGVASVVA